MAASQRQYHEERLETLKKLRQPWEEDYAEVDRVIVPGYYRNNINEHHHDQGTRKRQGIKNRAAQKAHRRFMSGMQSGMTSKARPWFKLTTHNKDLVERPAVKIYLDETSRRMREVMAKSNHYSIFHHKYGAHGAIGTAVSYMSPDDTYICRGTYLIAGSYWIATNALGFIDTLYHIIPMNAQQIVGMFNKSTDKIPDEVRRAYDQGERDRTFLVYHAMEPRKHGDRDPKRSEHPRHMPFLSNYWMAENKKDDMLRESGSKKQRVIGSRWDTVSVDAYGYSLGMDALADVKELQHSILRKMEVLDKQTRPPMTGPSSMKGQKHSLLPGSITYNDEAHASGAFRPAIDLSSYRLEALLQSIAELKDEVADTFYNDVFFAITNMEGVQPRNEFELAERKEEKLLQLGPALERLEQEELAPTIKLTYYYMKERGILPETPEELMEQEGEIAVEYTSIMAQAQRAVTTGSIERLTGFVGNLAGANPTILDKIDLDQAVDEYAERIGTPAAIVRSDEDVAEMRGERQQKEQAAEQAELASKAAPALKQGAEAAALLSQSDDTEGDPTRLLDELGLGGNEGLV